MSSQVHLAAKPADTPDQTYRGHDFLRPRRDRAFVPHQLPPETNSSKKLTQIHKPKPDSG